MFQNPSPHQDRASGSLESGIQGEYDLDLKEIIHEAWELQKGNKTTIWTALIITGVMTVISFFLLAQALGLDIEEASETDDLMTSLVLQLGMTALVVPLTTGLFMMVIKIRAGVEATPKEVFNYFDHTPKLIIWAMLQSLLTNIGLILLILPGVYLAVAYQLSLPVMIEKKLNPWRALEASRKAITTQWLTFFTVTLCLGLIAFFASITIIGIVFALPWYLCTMAIIYHRVFGYGDEQARPSQETVQPYKPIVPPTIAGVSEWAGTPNNEPIVKADPEPYREVLPPEIKPEPEPEPGSDNTTEDESEK